MNASQKVSLMSNSNEHYYVNHQSSSWSEPHHVEKSLCRKKLLKMVDFRVSHYKHTLEYCENILLEFTRFTESISIFVCVLERSWHYGFVDKKIKTHCRPTPANSVAKNS